MTSTDTTDRRLFNVRIIGRSKTWKLTMEATSAAEAKLRARNLGRFKAAGTRDISQRIEVVPALGPVARP